jgi:hypothetical protein
VRYAVRYYEHTAFFGKESDADVVITPAMAMIMPGVAGGGSVVEGASDDWALGPELGAAGAPSKPEGE